MAQKISLKQFMFFRLNDLPLPYIKPRDTPLQIAQNIINFLHEEDKILRSRIYKYRNFAKLIKTKAPGDKLIIGVKIDSDFRSGIMTQNQYQKYIIPDLSHQSLASEEKGKICYHKKPSFYFKILVLNPSKKLDWLNLNEVLPDFKF
jgi:hypothetical protein